MTAPVPTCPRCGTPAARATSRFCLACGASLVPEATGTALVPAVRGDLMTRRLPAPVARASGRPDLTPVRPGGPRMTPAARRRALIVAGGAALVLVAALVVYIVQVYAYDPRDPVRQAFAALTHRDAATLAQVIPGAADSPLYTAAAIRHGYEPPTDVRVGKVQYGVADEQTKRHNRTVATVGVTYRVGGTQHAEGISLAREDGLWKPWTITGGLSASLVVVSLFVHHVQLGGARVDVMPSGGDDGLMGDLGPYETDAPPGSWTMTVPGDPVWEMPAQQVTAVPRAADTSWGASALDASGDTLVPLRHLVAHDWIVKSVQQQVRDHIDRCATSHSIAPDGCPMSDDAAWTYPEPSATWTITQYPTITLQPVAGADEEAAGGSIGVETTTKGKATCRYKSYGDTTTDPITFEVGGHVKVKGHTATWSAG